MVINVPVETHAHSLYSHKYVCPVIQTDLCCKYEAVITTVRVVIEREVESNAPRFAVWRNITSTLFTFECLVCTASTFVQGPQAEGE